MTGKYLLRTYSPLQLAELRYGCSVAVGALLLAYFRWKRPQVLSPMRVITSLQNFHWIAALAITTFFGSAVVQYFGLTRSTATANSLIVAVEPLFAVLLAWMFLAESLSRRQVMAFALALAGFLLLSNLKPNNFFESLGLFNVGNLFFLAVMPMEAMYTIVSRRLAGRVQPLSIFGASISLGFILLTFYFWLSREQFPDLWLLDFRGAGALFLLGPLGTTITYIYWSIALVEAPVAAAALTLFIQPMLGAAAGLFFLGEHLDWWQIAGGIMILGALCLQSFRAKRSQP
jgi:drug/metabolite transporter (DMT)-like permease